MECPKCHKKGNVIRRVFAVKSRKEGTKYCMYCGAEVRITYNWSKIFLLIIGVIAFLILLNIILQKVFNMPGIGSLTAACFGGVLITLFMRNKPFTIIELTSDLNKNPKKSKKVKK